MEQQANSRPTALSACIIQRGARSRTSHTRGPGSSPCLATEGSSSTRSRAGEGSAQRPSGTPPLPLYHIPTTHATLHGLYHPLPVSGSGDPLRLAHHSQSTHREINIRSDRCVAAYDPDMPYCHGASYSYSHATVRCRRAPRTLAVSRPIAWSAWSRGARHCTYNHIHAACTPLCSS